MSRSLRRRWVLPAVLLLLSVVMAAWFLRRADLAPEAAVSGDPAPAPAAAAAPALEPVLPVAEPVPAVPEPLGSRTKLAADALRIRVVDAPGHPVEHALVLLAQNGRVLDHRATDAGGWVEFPAIDAGVTAFVLRGTSIRHREDLPRGRGEHTLVLLPLEVLAGHVLVDGSEPGHALEFRLTSDETSGVVEVPQFVFDALGWRGRDDRASFLFETDPSGAFRLDGLPSSWSGHLDVPMGYDAADGEEPIRIPGPRPDLVLHLHLRPAIVGRVVDPQGDPVPSARVRYEITGENSGESGQWECDEDGVFRHPLYDSVQRCSLFLVAADVGSRVVEVGAVDEAVGVDLGDIVLEPASDLAFHVQDDAGVPIEGAVARTLGGAPIESAPTDGGGMGVLQHLPLEQNQLEFSALRFRSQVASAPTDRSQILEVVLSPLASLSIRVRTAGGMFVPGVFVCLSVPSQAAFEADPPNQPDQRQLELGASSFRHLRWTDESDDGGWVLAVYETDSRGEVLVTGLAIGAAVTAHVEDATGQGIAAERTIRIAGPGEQSLVFTLDREPAWCEVIVMDARGLGLEHASVWVGRGSEDGLTQANTDSEGRAWFGNLFSDHIVLEVSRSGYASARAEAQLTAERPTRVEVMLSSGREVVLTVCDQRGGEVSAESAEARAGGKAVGSGWRLGPGKFQLVGLPDAPLVLRAQVGGQWFEQAYDTFGQPAAIAVPAFGSVSLEWAGPPLDPDHVHLVVLERPGGGGGGIRRFARYAEIEPGLRFPAVFPGEYQVRLWGLLADGTELEPAPSASVVVSADRETAVVLAP